MERQKLQTLNNSGIADNTSLKDRRECEKLRDRWGSDPMIHLTPAGNSALAESLIDSCSAEKEEKKETARSPSLPL